MKAELNKDAKVDQQRIIQQNRSYWRLCLTAVVAAAMWKGIFETISE